MRSHERRRYPGIWRLPKGSGCERTGVGAQRPPTPPHRERFGRGPRPATLGTMPGRARPEEQAQILAAVLARVAERGRSRRVVVLDLDSTLLDNRPRVERIVREYGRAAGLAALRDARVQGWHGWSMEATLSAAGLSPEEAARHAAAARLFWTERFFTSGYCREDVPIPGAPAFARAVAAAGARIAYVTGRPDAMRPGTLDVFTTYGFPFPERERVHLLTRPDGAGSDDAWKAEAMETVERLGTVVAALDNEPAHVNAYAARWPDALCVHLDTDHSDRAVEVLPRIPSVLDLRTAPGPLGRGLIATAR
jgi:hypothetical protein